jgi:Protein of unknown function (DUF2934)
MSTRRNNGSHYENHQQAAELHDLGAHAHRAAARKTGSPDGRELSRQALDHFHSAYLHSKAASEFGNHDIAAFAHELWQATGRPDGSPRRGLASSCRTIAIPQFRPLIHVPREIEPLPRFCI